MTVKTKFEVTKKAGDWVAGVRSPGEGETLELSEAQAHYALIAGELKRPDTTTAVAPKPTKPKS